MTSLSVAGGRMVMTGNTGVELQRLTYVRWNHSFNLARADAAWGDPRMAPQQELGILSERRARSCPVRPDHPARHGENLTVWPGVFQD